MPFRTPKLTVRTIALVLLALAILSRPLVARSSEIRFDRILAEKGLSQNSILCILQDSRGFMWFGTHDGLNRYDGYTRQAFDMVVSGNNAFLPAGQTGSNPPGVAYSKPIFAHLGTREPFHARPVLTLEEAVQPDMPHPA